MSGLSSNEIKYLYKKGKKVYSKFFTFFFLPSEELKIAAVVSKKISKKAVIRNKIKRRIKHLSRDFLKEGSFIVIPKQDISQVKFEDLQNDFKKICDKIR
ncbi:ribonuclease P protein component [Caminibacter sp.]